MKALHASIAAVCVWSLCWGAALQALGDDTAEIRANSQAFAEAFNKHDAKAVAEHWTADGDFVDAAGETHAGRAAIEAAYARFLRENPQTKLRLVVDSVRVLNDTTAIEDGRSLLEPPPAGAPGFGKYTAVLLKTDGKWRLATVRESWVATPSGYDNVADLEWLIGTWHAEEHGVKSESVCRWIANKSFVERTYTATQPNGATTSGVQIIGWNPLEGHVQSWNFSSDGGHAVGIWRPQQGGWMAQLTGTTGDGQPTSSVTLLKRLDDNAYVWQSTQRTLDGESLPDTDEVVLRRQTGDR